MPKGQKGKGLTPLEYSEKYTKAHIEAVCVRAGTNYDYWKRIRDRRQRPSVDLAMALVAESGGELALMGLLFRREDTRGIGAPPIRPYRRATESSGAAS